VRKDDGTVENCSTSQYWLWENWLKLIEKAQSYNGNLITILNGDAIEGDTKDRTFQVVTRNPATLLKIAEECHEPIRKASKAMFVVRGTAAHGGKSGNLEESMARDLECEKTDIGTYSAYQWNLNVEGLHIDAAHHTNMSGVPWIKKEAAAKLAAKMIFAAADAHENPPDIVLRSHVHRWSDSYDMYRTRVIILPCWSLATEYTYRIAPGSIADIGAVFIHIDSGMYEVDKFKVTPMRKLWRVV
jgi:hypothetical protein